MTAARPTSAARQEAPSRAASDAVTLVWLRQDLRLTDQPALQDAARRGTVVPVFVWHPEGAGAWAPGAASRWWLDRSLRSLETALAAAGTPLVVRVGDPAVELPAIAREVGATRLNFGRCHEPAAVLQAEEVVDAFVAHGGVTEAFETNLLFAPESIRSQEGRPYRVFTPFWRTCMAQAPVREPVAVPKSMRGTTVQLRSVPIDALQLRPTVPWDAGLAAAWQPGEVGARALLEEFVANGARDYATARDRPDIAGTSRLSPHLHFGEISPRQVWHALKGAEKFRAELGWREFAAHVLASAPRTAQEPLRREFQAFPWRADPAQLRAWQRGQTGYPLVDAGMRQLWATGWMHNRVRMVVASFLVKHLLIDWLEGARWFWQTLVDADLASNTLGWQWAGGCGADAAPYFRIFNPVTQGQRFDPQGAYVHRWVPELRGLAAPAVHAPWEASPLELHAAGIELGVTYPAPIVNHTQARARALQALAELTARGGGASA